MSKIVQKSVINDTFFNPHFEYPFELREMDFKNAMTDVYDFFFDVNNLLVSKGLQRLDDMTRPAALSGILSDMLTSSLARFSRSLVPNEYFNGHPDLVLRGHYPNNSVASGVFGVEIKSTKKKGGAVDTHGAREQWMCVFVYIVDNDTEPSINRDPMKFTEVYLAKVTEEDFRRNVRHSDKATKTATLDRNGLKKMRSSWIYIDTTI